MLIAVEAVLAAAPEQVGAVTILKGDYFIIVLSLQAERLWLVKL